MKTKFIFLLCSLFFFTNVYTQHLGGISTSDFNLTITNVEDFEFDKPVDNYPIKTLQNTIDPVLADSLQAALNRVFNQLTPIGLSVAVNFGEDDIWASTAGISSNTDSLDTHHVFPIGSVSKTITSACILSMVDEGLLTLEDSIGTWISGYPEIAGSIKVYELMNHTSGIYNYTSHPNFGPIINANLGTIYTMTDMLDNFVNAPDFNAGEDWGYSNTNYLLLGLIIESISQKDYHTEVRDRVLAPNGFDDIVLLPQEQLTGPLPDVWQSQPPINVSELVPSLDGIFSSASAAGAYVATPTDISEWARQLYSGDILGMATDLLDDYRVDIGNNNEYGLGLITAPIDAENSVIGHEGAIIYTSFVYYIPEKDVSFAIHTNDGTKIVNLSTVFLELYNELVEYEISVGNEEVAEAIGLNVYPNPADNQLFVAFELPKNQAMQIVLYQLNGQQVKTFHRDLTSGQQQIKLDVSDLASGTYFLELTTETGTTTEKIILK